MLDGSCVTSPNPDAWFPPQGNHGGEAQAALKACRKCPVAEKCLTYALDHPALDGIWGGTTRLERRERRRKKTA